MEYDIVLTNEMHKLRLLILPPGLPRFRKKFLSIGNIADRRVKPDIQHFAFSTLDWYRHSPVQITAHSPRLQMRVKPGLALTVNIGLPLLVLLENPLAEPRLILIQWQIPVFGLHLLRLASAQCGFRVYQLLRAQCRAAFLALVAISIRIAAFRASSCYITVCKKDFCLRVEELLGLLCDELTVIIQFAEEIRRILVVDLGGCPGIDIEIDTQSGE